MYQVDELLLKYGDKVKNLREEKGMTQQELADKTHINIRQIQRIEAGEVNCYFGTFYALCDYLDISIDSVFYPDMPKDDSDFLRIRGKMSACQPEDRRIILNTMEYMTNQFLKK